MRCLQSQNLKNKYNLVSATNNLITNLIVSVGLGIDWNSQVIMRAGGFRARHAAKMNAAAEVLSLKHWPPRGVYTRWRPRKRFCSGIVCIPPTSARKLPAPVYGVCSKLDIRAVIFCYFRNATPQLRPSKVIHTKQFQNGTLAKLCPRAHRTTTPARVLRRFAVTPLIRPESMSSAEINTSKPTSHY